MQALAAALPPDQASVAAQALREGYLRAVTWFFAVASTDGGYEWEDDPIDQTAAAFSASDAAAESLRRAASG